MSKAKRHSYIILPRITISRQSEDTRKKCHHDLYVCTSPSSDFKLKKSNVALASIAPPSAIHFLLIHAFTLVF